MKGQFGRIERLLGTDMLRRINSAKVIIFGVGGVGSWCAESLVRSGIQHITIVDSDRVSISNINRQLMATTKTVGKVKVEALRERLLDINPDAHVEAVQEIYSDENNALFHLEDYDYIIDCIDSLKDKYALILNACNTQATFFSSMGAALKIDPLAIRVAEYWKVRGCPLGAALRKKMKRAKVKPAHKFLCVYSEEVLENKGEVSEQKNVGNVTFDDCKKEGREDLMDHDWNNAKAQINGSLVHITAIFGNIIAGLVMQDIAGKE